MTSTQFFAVIAGMEVGAGLTLIVAPELVIRLLFGPEALPCSACYPGAVAVAHGAMAICCVSLLLVIRLRRP
jgi:hypothetical protein